MLKIPELHLQKQTSILKLEDSQQTFHRLTKFLDLCNKFMEKMMTLINKVAVVILGKIFSPGITNDPWLHVRIPNHQTTSPIVVLYLQIIMIREVGCDCTQIHNMS